MDLTLRISQVTIHTGIEKMESELEAVQRQKRLDMVRTQIESRGVNSPLVLEAMRKVPRHSFVPLDKAEHAYEDRPLSIGFNQTISQPYIVAYMTQALRLTRGEKVLEVGTGLGYQAAVLASIAREVYTVERIPQLVQQAQSVLQELGYTNVFCRTGDGTMGWPEEAPFDAIMVTASGPNVPEALLDQLAQGGRLVMPVGKYRLGQYITRLTKGQGDHLQEEKLLDVAFVPLIGAQGWEERG
ncbi:MAG: protein-L-isoaspartate(D-aspartate) O-methyltransferase [Desulfohalobiaceae bacterium]